MSEFRGVVQDHVAVPDFDPLDGGIDAEVLFLLEKPGPKTDHTAIAGRVGSGFISRDNDDPTAEATLRFMEAANIDRKRSVIWNTVPWWNGTRDISPQEHRDGIERLALLIDMLPKLRVVVGVGAKTRKAEPLVTKNGLKFISSAQPSPINRASRPSVWAEIPRQWAQAKAHFSKRAGDF
ncbi:MAG: uracil-DNA glycosylase [Cypionkella sp.]